MSWTLIYTVCINSLFSFSLILQPVTFRFTFKLDWNKVLGETRLTTQIRTAAGRRKWKWRNPTAKRVPDASRKVKNITLLIYVLVLLRYLLSAKTFVTEAK